MATDLIGADHILQGEILLDTGLDVGAGGGGDTGSGATFNAVNGRARQSWWGLIRRFTLAQLSLDRNYYFITYQCYSEADFKEHFRI